jgi:hypothetical protein
VFQQHLHHPAWERHRALAGLGLQGLALTLAMDLPGDRDRRIRGIGEVEVRPSQAEQFGLARARDGGEPEQGPPRRKQALEAELRARALRRLGGAG